MNKRRVLKILAFTLLTFSLSKVGMWIFDNKNTQIILDSLDESVIINENLSDEDYEEKYNIDFKALKNKNNDTVAWLKVNGTNIKYPVVKTSNNYYYINHDFTKSERSAGWVFINYKNKLDGSDKNISIFAHARLDDSMFGSMRYIFKPEWTTNQDNYNVIFITENEKNLYKVFSTYKIEAEDYYLKNEFANDQEFEEFLSTIKSRSNFDYGVEITSNSHILTLSTCDYNNAYRLVLHAVKA